MTPAPYQITALMIVDNCVSTSPFEDGREGEVDLRGPLQGPVFEGVRTPEGFREAFLRNGIVVQPGEVDLPPDTLYERVRTGAWPEALPASSQPGRLSPSS